MGIGIRPGLRRTCPLRHGRDTPGHDDPQRVQLPRTPILKRPRPRPDRSADKQPVSHVRPSWCAWSAVPLSGPSNVEYKPEQGNPPLKRCTGDVARAKQRAFMRNLTPNAAQGRKPAGWRILHLRLPFLGRSRHGRATSQIPQGVIHGSSSAVSPIREAAAVRSTSAQ